MGPAVQRVLEAARTQGRPVRRNGQRGWLTTCPAHPDTRPSLGIAEGDKGALVHCRSAGCSWDAIVAGLGLRTPQLFDDYQENGRGTTTSHRPKTNVITPSKSSVSDAEHEPGTVTLADYAAHVQLPLDFLQQAGLTEGIWDRGPCVEIPYRNEAGGQTDVSYRIDLATNGHRWKYGAKCTLYGLDNLHAARDAGAVTLVEGVTDSLALDHAGILAIGLPGARSWRDEWAADFDRIEQIFLVREPDEGGDALVADIAASPIAERVRVVTMPDGMKDPLDLWRTVAPDVVRFAKAWEECVDDSVPLVKAARLIEKELSNAVTKFDRDEADEAESPLLPRIDLFEPYTSTHARADAILAGEGISTGIACLDRAEFRLQPGNVWTYAGRQGGGKTSLLLETAMRHVESTPDACALFVSFEGSRYEIYRRLLLRQVAIGRVEDDKPPRAPRLVDATRWLKTARVFEHEARDSLATEWETELARAAEVLDGHLLAHRFVLIDGDDVPDENGGGGVTASRIMDALRLAPRRPTLATFDYWQKLTPGNRAETRYVQLKETADRLRRYAKGDGDPAQAVVVLTAAQVNREAKGQPGLEHIRESDDLGNDGAGVVTLLLAEGPDPIKKMQLQVVKNRFGPNGGRGELLFHGGCGYFAEVGAEAEQEARSRKRAERIRADVERIHADDPTATMRAVRDAVRGRGVHVDAVYREVFGRAE